MTSPTLPSPGPARTPVSARIRMYRTFFTALDEVKKDVKQAETTTKSWKHRFWGLALLGLVALGGIVAAISTVQNSFSGISGETYSYDTATLSLNTQGHSVVGSAAAAAGATNSLVGAVEMAASNGGAANTALTAGHWEFQATVSEASIASVTSLTAYYKVELFVDGTSQGALYMKNTVSDILTAEGVTFKWDIGSSLAANGAYVIKVSQMAA